MRPLAALFLSLVLAVGSMSMALARGQAPMGEAIALCIEGQAITAVLDAEGNPQPLGPHPCPDCLSAATAFTLPGELGLSGPQASARPLLAATAPGLPVGRDRIPGHARDPPIVPV